MTVFHFANCSLLAFGPLVSILWSATSSVKGNRGTYVFNFLIGMVLQAGLVSLCWFFLPYIPDSSWNEFLSVLKTFSYQNGIFILTYFDPEWWIISTVCPLLLFVFFALGDNRRLMNSVGSDSTDSKVNQDTNVSSTTNTSSSTTKSLDWLHARDQVLVEYICRCGGVIFLLLLVGTASKPVWGDTLVGDLQDSLSLDYKWGHLIYSGLSVSFTLEYLAMCLGVCLVVTGGRIGNKVAVGSGMGIGIRGRLFIAAVLVYLIGARACLKDIQELYRYTHWGLYAYLAAVLPASLLVALKFKLTM
eukprot:Nk52_evm12s2622 gene=Nk52_evmTU12s2622